MTGVAVGNEVLARPGAGAARDGRVYVRESTANFLASSYPPAARSTRRPRSRLAISLSGEARAGGGDEVRYEPAAGGPRDPCPDQSDRALSSKKAATAFPASSAGDPAGVIHPVLEARRTWASGLPSGMALARHHPARVLARLNDKDDRVLA